MVDTNKKIEVVKLIFDVSNNVKHYMRGNFEDSGMTMPQTMVIGLLIQNGEMKITDLSSKINLSNSTISGIVDRLEKQQLVVRTRSEEDRRTVYVKTTPKVEEIHERIHKRVKESFESLLSNVTSEEINKIVEGLNVLKKVLSDRKE